MHVTRSETKKLAPVRASFDIDACTRLVGEEEEFGERGKAATETQVRRSISITSFDNSKTQKNSAPKRGRNKNATIICAKKAKENL